MPNVPMIQVATEVESIGRVLVAKYHPHLADANIVYLFTDQTRKKCDRVRLGSAKKMSAMERFLASTMESVESGPDFILMFDYNIWPNLSEKQQVALTDHELCHCAVSVNQGAMRWRLLLPDENKEDFGEFRWALRGHDIEEFADIFIRHGAWQAEGPESKVVEAIRQLALPGLAIQTQSRN